MTNKFVWEASIKHHVVLVGRNADYFDRFIKYDKTYSALVEFPRPATGGVFATIPYLEADRYTLTVRLVKVKQEVGFKKNHTISAAIDQALSEYELPFEARIKLMDLLDKELGYMTKKVRRDRG